jgi:hypothetical protein
MLRFARLAALALASAVASTSFAAQITVAGAIHASTGTVGPAAVNSNFTQHISGTGSGTGFQADIRIINSVANGTQCFTVEVESMRFDKYISGSRQITLEIIQDFTVETGYLPNGTATQTFNATANVPSAGQTTSFIADAFHEGTQLPRFQGQNGSSGGGWTPIDCGTSTPVSLLQAGTYRIRALYTFTLSSSNANWMALEVIPGQHDDVSTTGCLTLVPLPPAAWAGLAGLGLVGGVSYVRSRKLKQCNVTSEVGA